MKYLDMDEINERPYNQVKDNETFCFRCHSSLACFNQCCRNLKLFLYPYDVIRLKKGLGISSDSFLDQYVNVIMRDGNCFPDVLLKMAENDEQTCPFLQDSGCSIYPDRPYACRTFPMELGMLYKEKIKKSEFVYWFRPPDFCLGKNESTQWTPETWMTDQDAKEFHRMTVQWSDLKRLFQNDSWGGEGNYGQKAKMAFMAIYNIDQFREFVFKSSFLKRYHLKSNVKERIRVNDTALMQFSFNWVKFFVWGIACSEFQKKY